jgi:hypothetical protein
LEPMMLARTIAQVLLAGRVGAALCLTPSPSANQIGGRVMFKNGSTRLTRSLLLPTGPGLHPAFVAIGCSAGAS